MAKITQSKIRISITIIPFINKMLETVSKKERMSKSALVEAALKEFLTSQLKKDAQSLAKMKFPDLPSEEDWMSIQAETLSE